MYRLLEIIRMLRAAGYRLPGGLVLGILIRLLYK